MIYGLMAVRKNSTRLPDKNLKDFGGMSLFEFAAREVMRSEKLDKIIVISDDERVWEICEYLNLEWIAEPEDLANQNNAHLVTEFVMDFLGLQNEDIILYLPPTAPFRTSKDIDSAIHLFQSKFCESVVSMRVCQDPPEWSFPLNVNTGFVKFTNDFLWTSQNRVKYYCLNGALYVARVGFLKRNRSYFGKRTLPYIMDYSRSIDIDEQKDYEKACQYLDIIKNKKNKKLEVK